MKNISISKSILFSTLFLIVNFSSPLRGQGYWSDYWISEERGLETALPGGYLAGYCCSGSYCDDRKLFFRSGENFWEGPVRRYVPPKYSKPISEETGSFIVDDGYLISGLQCTGDYCDNIILEMTKTTLKVHRDRAFWTGWISEENGRNRYVAPAGHFIIGYDCRGSYCDDRRFLVAPVSRE